MCMHPQGANLCSPRAQTSVPPGRKPLFPWRIWSTKKLCKNVCAYYIIYLYLYTEARTDTYWHIHAYTHTHTHTHTHTVTYMCALTIQSAVLLARFEHSKAIVDQMIRQDNFMHNEAVRACQFHALHTCTVMRAVCVHGGCVYYTHADCKVVVWLHFTCAH